MLKTFYTNISLEMLPFWSMALYPRCLGKNTMPAELSIVSQHLLAVQNPHGIAATCHQQQPPSKFVPTSSVTVSWDLMYFHHTSQDQITQLSWNTTCLYFWMIFPLIIRQTMYFIHNGESLTSALLLASFLIVILVLVREVKMDRPHDFCAHFYVWRHKSLWWMVKHLVSVNTLWQTARQFTIHWGFLGIYKRHHGDTVS